MSKREDILDAALELFAERGFYGTPVPLIAKCAGVGAGTIYRYFDSKEGLVNALFQKWKRALSQAMLEDFATDLPLRQTFHEALRRWIAFAQEHPTVMMFLEFHHHAPYLDETSQEMAYEYMEPIRQFYERACEEGITKDAPTEVLMAIVWGTLMETMKAHWSGQIKLTPALIDQIEEICWQAICC